MSDASPSYGNEMDFLELVDLVWAGRRLIGLFAVFAFFLGFGYAQLATPIYEISVRYKVNIYTVKSLQLCKSQSFRRKPGCFDRETSQILGQKLGAKWNFVPDQYKLKSQTSTTLSIANYRTLLSNASTATNAALKEEALFELATINTLLNTGVLANEQIRTNMLNARRNIQAIDSGQEAVVFDSIKLVKLSPNALLISVLSVTLALVIGTLVVFARSATSKRKKWLSRT